MLLAIHGRGLAGGPGDHEAVRPFPNVKLDQALERRIIDPITGVERGRQGNQRAFEHR